FYTLQEEGQFSDLIRGGSNTVRGNQHGGVRRQEDSGAACFRYCQQCDGNPGSYIEMPDSQVFSITNSGQLTIAAWMRPDVLDFANFEGADPPTDDGRYVYWMAKADETHAHYEWQCRMYSKHQADGVTLNNRPNRISSYYFNAAGGLGS